MPWAPTGEWMQIVPSDPQGLARANALRTSVLAPAMRQFPLVNEVPQLPATLSPDTKQASALARQLVDAEIVFADITDNSPDVLHLLGVRDIVADRMTLALSENPTETQRAIFKERLVPYNPATPDATQKAIAEIVGQDPLVDAHVHSSLIRRRMAGVNVSVASPAIGRRTPGEKVPDKLWEVFPEGADVNDPSQTPSRTRIGLWAGNIALIQASDNIHALVNSENTFFEMARIHDRGVSAIVRYLGSDWRSGFECDDIVYRELIDRSPLKRPVPPAHTVVTGPGRMADLGVKAIAHVAAVQPVNIENQRAGLGYEPVRNLEECVINALVALEKRFAGAKPATRTVLIPLVGTGAGGGDSRAISHRLIHAALGYIRHKPDSKFDRVLFLTYCRLDQDLCAAVLRYASSVRPL